jgi:hypothetical protein
VKPEDQGTFFQDFLGLSGYLCSIGGFYSNAALLRTRNAQNHNEAQRLASAAIVREDNEPILLHVGHNHSFFVESAARCVERTSHLWGFRLDYSLKR